MCLKVCTGTLGTHTPTMMSAQSSGHIVYMSREAYVSVPYNPNMTVRHLTQPSAWESDWEL